MEEEAESGQNSAKDSIELHSFAYRILKRGQNLCKLPYDNKRSLFIFSEDNVIRKHARMIIEWGYPFEKKFLNIFLVGHSKELKILFRF